MCKICRKEVPNNVEKLEILHCNKITSIPSYPNLKELYISWCTNIISIPYYPNLKELL